MASILTYPRYPPSATWSCTRSRVFSAGTRVSTMPRGPKTAGSAPTRPFTPNSPPSWRQHAERRARARQDRGDDRGGGGAERVGPRRPQARGRASMRASCTCESTRAIAYPPIDASLQGTTNPAGGTPSTVSVTSRGEHSASIATIAVIADTRASGDEPIRRARRTYVSEAALLSRSGLRRPRKHHRRVAKVRGDAARASTGRRRRATRPRRRSGRQ